MLQVESHNGLKKRINLVEIIKERNIMIGRITEKDKLCYRNRQTLL